MIPDAPVRARRRSVALAVLLALASSAPVFAQTQLYLLTSGSYVPNPQCGYWDYGCEFYLTRDPGRVIHFDVDRQQIAAITPVSDAYDSTIGPRVTPDGRFLLWSGWNLDLGVPIRVSLFDIADRQQATPLAGGWPYVPLTVHPSEMRAFLSCRRAARSWSPNPATPERYRCHRAALPSSRHEAGMDAVCPTSATVRGV